MAGEPGEDSYTIWLQKHQPVFVAPSVQFVTLEGHCRNYGYDFIISMNDPFYSVNVISYGKRNDWRTDYISSEFQFLWRWMKTQCEGPAVDKCHKEWKDGKHLCAWAEECDARPATPVCGKPDWVLYGEWSPDGTFKDGITKDARRMG